MTSSCNFNWVLKGINYLNDTIRVIDLIEMEEGLQFKVSFDAYGKPLDGGKTYRLHLPADIPARNFWSLIVYDSRTKLIIKTDQAWPSVHRQLTGLHINQDGSLDVWFGPKATTGHEINWVKTIAGKGWYLILRLYGPLESWFDNSWRPEALVQFK